MPESAQYTYEQLRHIAEAVKQAPHADCYILADGSRIEGNLARSLARSLEQQGGE